MAKRKSKAKRSLASLPKGLPQKRSAVDVNPFETSSRSKKPKYEVHNRFSTSQTQSKPSKLAQSLQRRQTQLKQVLKQQKKSNTFVDRRIGEYNPDYTEQDQMLARIVKERARRSKRMSKYSLDDDNGDMDGGFHKLTHKGKAIDQLSNRNHVILSSDEEDGGNLDALDTELHFGGMGARREQSAYGSAGATSDLTQVYSQRKTELDDMIARRKMLKAEKMMSKEKQAETFEALDDSFKELSQLLQFRDKEKEYKERLEAKRNNTLTQEDKEMAEWDKEMKTYLYERRVKATDRTKTPEEIAKEEAERLHELETRRLARMNGDFEDDEFSDISDNDDEADTKSSRKAKSKKQLKKSKAAASSNPEALDNDSDNDDDDDNELKPRFTADGLVFLDKDSKIVKRASDESDEDEEEGAAAADSDSDKDESVMQRDPNVILPIGTRVKANYHAKEQYGGEESWYPGKISQVHMENGTVTFYDIDYDDGDFEDGVEPDNVQPIGKTSEEKEKETRQHDEEASMKRKRQKAKDKARQEIPFVFEVPTTLEALHDMIGNYASAGKEASLIIQRIHSSNSVRLDRRNKEKMQNFYDVLLRRFVAVGDAIYSSGDGGKDLGRYAQLDALTKTLYAMAQDSPACAGAVWGRRLGIFQSAHAKRLRDAEFIHDDEDDSDDEDQQELTAWPSTGTLLLMRALGHVFPVTDLRHPVVTPALLLLGQMVVHTPVRSIYDLVMGVMCSALMIEYTKEANRIAPEALAFLAGLLGLFSSTPVRSPVPSLEAARQIPALQSFRKRLADFDGDEIPRLSVERDAMHENPATTIAALLASALQLVETVATELSGGALQHAETEAFAEITDALLALKPSCKKDAIPKLLANKVGATAKIVSNLLLNAESRPPLTRRSGPSMANRAIKSLAPRVEDYSRYSMSKDKGKSATQAALDRTRREYKREHKAVSRELKLDAAMVERERLREKNQRDGKARAKRNANFAWLEGEQEAMNQQVRQGGGLLSGGGMGLARAKAKTKQMGIKKGGKF